MLEYIANNFPSLDWNVRSQVNVNWIPTQYIQLLNANEKLSLADDVCKTLFGRTHSLQPWVSAFLSFELVASGLHEVKSFRTPASLNLEPFSQWRECSA